jgi:uncharacterized SAM-binding protein YcdF (DUF218 family)
VRVGAAGGLLGAARLCAAAFPDAVGWTLALFSLLNVLGDVIAPGFDANYTWMPLDLYGPWARAFMGLFGGLLLWSLVRPAAGAARYALTQALLLFLCVECLRQIWNFYSALASGRAATWLPIPFALFVAAALLMQVLRVRSGFCGAPSPPPSARAARVAATGTGMLLVWELFLIGQMFLVGAISWPHPADCIIVMGAGVSEEGQPSVALIDRVRNGVYLYRRGCARRVIMSGGPGGNLRGPTEPEVMASLALAWKVPREAVIRDELGHTSFETVRSCRKIMARNGWRSAVVVSHDYHLSRTALAFYRARLPVSTDPAPRTRIQGVDFYNVFRESFAWTYYYLRPFWQSFDAP